MFGSQRVGPQVSEKGIFWVVKLTKDWEKIGVYFKGAEKEFAVASFISALRKERSASYSQEETELKFGQAVGNNRTSWPIFIVCSLLLCKSYLHLPVM